MKDTEERDLLFCELLFELGSVSKASEQLGITLRTGRKIAERRKDWILDMTNSELSALAYKAVNTVRATLEDDDLAPKADIRLKAAEGVLDRIGAGKKQDVTVSVDTPVILMPSKDILKAPVIKVSSE